MPSDKWEIPDDASPILFQGPLVRAIIEGRKTVTRRIILPQPEPGTPVPIPPKWQKGRALYVREAWRAPDTVDDRSPRAIGQGCLDAGYPTPWCPVQYDADEAQIGKLEELESKAWGKGRPSIHMPKWLSRILLRVKKTKAEPLHEMPEADALLEGLEDQGDPQINLFHFSVLWDRINGPRGFHWTADPWVYRVEFELEGVRRG
jgi:hypothetical protein